MGANKTYQQKGDKGRVLGESDEFRRLRRAIDKAQSDRDQAIRNVCRLYGVKTIDALPDPGSDVGATWSARMRGSSRSETRLAYENAAGPRAQGWVASALAVMPERTRARQAA
jgi:hypothetical protein